MDDTNGKKIKMAEDIAALKVQVSDIKEQQKEHHKEIIQEFKELKSKVNEEITMMQTNIKEVKQCAFDKVAANRKFYIRLLIGTIVVGSFLWIKESRDWILTHIFNFI